MNCVLKRCHVVGDLFVPEGVPVRVVRMGRTSQDWDDPEEDSDDAEASVLCIASVALRGEQFVRDVEIEVRPGMLLFMSVDPELAG